MNKETGKNFSRFIANCYEFEDEKPIVGFSVKYKNRTCMVYNISYNDVELGLITNDPTDYLEK